MFYFYLDCICFQFCSCRCFVLFEVSTFRLDTLFNFSFFQITRSVWHYFYDMFHFSSIFFYDICWLIDVLIIILVVFLSMCRVCSFVDSVRILHFFKYNSLIIQFAPKKKLHKLIQNKKKPTLATEIAFQLASPIRGSKSKFHRNKEKLLCKIMFIIQHTCCSIYATKSFTHNFCNP